MLIYEIANFICLFMTSFFFLNTFNAYIWLFLVHMARKTCPNEPSPSSLVNLKWRSCNLSSSSSLSIICLSDCSWAFYFSFSSLDYFLAFSYPSGTVVAEDLVSDFFISALWVICYFYDKIFLFAVSSGFLEVMSFGAGE